MGFWGRPDQWAARRKAPFGEGDVELASAQGAGWLELRALHSLASRFPDHAAREQLGDLVETIPSGHDLPAFRAAMDLLSEPG